MKCPPVFILAGALCLTAAADEPKERERVPRRERGAQVALEFEWVKMPTTDANRLLRRTVQNCREAKALRTAVDEALTAGKAQRMDYMTINVMDGERSAIEALLEEPYGTEWKAEPGGDGQMSFSAISTEAGELGGTVTASVAVTSDLRAVDVNFTAEWKELSGHILWKAGTDPIEQPVFSTMKATRVARLSSGEWTLQGVMPSFSVPGGERTSGAMKPETPDCVLLLSKAAVDTDPPEGTHKDETPHCLVICEWIGMDASAATELTGRFPDPASGEAFREALEAEIGKGTAVLEDMAAVAVVSGKRGKDEAVCEMPRAAKFKTSKDGRQAPLSLHTSSSGRTFEIEAKRSSGHKRWELTLDPVDGRVQESGGAPPEKKAGTTAAEPAKTKCTLKVAPDTTVLAATLWNRGDPDSGGKDRATLLFVKLFE